VPPAAPTSVTSFTRDAGANIAFLAPAFVGSGPVTSYTVTPYISGAAQSPTTVAAGSMNTISGSDGNTYLHTDITGLVNSTDYTFTVYARNSAGGAGPESSQSGVNTPFAGLVFGDNFNGPANGPVHPEWWIYDNRCGYLAQSEIEAYKGDHCTLDGSSDLQLKAEKLNYTVPRYPSDPLFPGNVTQSWRSGACQSNTRSYAPSADANTMTFETRFQVCPGVGQGMWPGLLWMEGTDFQAQWKTDPNQPSWNTTGKAEMDIAEFGSPGQGSPATSPTSFLSNISTSGSFIPEGGTAHSGSTDFSAAMHVFSLTWKGTSVQANRAVNWYLDAPYVPGTGPSGGTNVATLSNNAAIPAQSSCSLFLLLYLQIVSGSATATQSCLVDYVRIYDQAI